MVTRKHVNTQCTTIYRARNFVFSCSLLLFSFYWYDPINTFVGVCGQWLGCLMFILVVVSSEWLWIIFVLVNMFNGNFSLSCVKRVHNIKKKSFKIEFLNVILIRAKMWILLKFYLHCRLQSRAKRGSSEDYTPKLSIKCRNSTQFTNKKNDVRRRRWI